jgi:predicted CoA-binding protein
MATKVRQHLIYFPPPTHHQVNRRLVFAWYINRSLPVTPINPTASSINIPSAISKSKDFSTLSSLSDLPKPKETSVSIITPPPATLKVLQEARELGVPAVWMQPGTYDDEVLKYAREDGAFPGGVVVGEGGRGHDGWCVLVDGDRTLKAAGKL